MSLNKSCKRSVKHTHIGPFRKPGYLTIAEFDNHPTAIASLRHIHSEKTALHVLRNRIEEVYRRSYIAVYAFLPVLGKQHRFSIKKEQAEFSGERHATFRVCGQLLKIHKLAEYQTLVQIF